MMKRFILFLAAAMMLPQSLFAYDFSAPSTTGQTLYFNIIGQNAVEVTSHPFGAAAPSGILEIPSSVELGGTSYSVTRIEGYAFLGCEELTSVTFPSTLTIIGEHAFDDCTGLTSLYFQTNSVISIGDYAFTHCSSLASVNFPNSLTSIGNNAFDDCSSLASVNFPNSLTNIGEFAFYFCTSLISVTIPSSITSIENGVFSNCYNLVNVNIPASVVSIGQEAFNYCAGIREIHSEASAAPDLEDGAFGRVLTSLVSVYVPCGSVAAYRSTAGWSDFTNILEINGCSQIPASGISIFTDDNDIVVEGAEGQTVTLYDDYGNVRDTGTTPVRFQNLTSGTYHVKVGILPARMKVVVQ